nr:unnamed protein product [Callosobruchus analis]
MSEHFLGHSEGGRAAALMPLQRFKIFLSTEIQVIGRNRGPAVLLDDAGFGVAPWLMTPFRTPDGPVQQAFNNMLTRERVTIERCFGQIEQYTPVYAQVT